MVVRANRLTVAGIRAALAEGRRQRLHDGGNLVLQVRGPGAGYWVFRYSAGPHKRELGLGPYDPASRDGLSLAAAREEAAEWRSVLRRGLDPIGERRRRERAHRGVPTFREAAEAFLETMLSQYRNAKHRQQWRNTLRTYAFPGCARWRSRSGRRAGCGCGCCGPPSTGSTSTCAGAGRESATNCR